MATRKNTALKRGKPPSLPDVLDALATINANVDVAATALETEQHTIAGEAAMVLHRSVSLPLMEQRARLSVYTEHLVKERPKKKPKKARRGWGRK